MPQLYGMQAIEILDSRGNPTLQVTVLLNDGSRGIASVPSGASTGTHEALELRDGDPKRYGGKGVIKAMNNVNRIIAENLAGKELDDMRVIDATIRAIDGTPNKSMLGANACLGASLAIAHALAASAGKPLYKFLANHYGFKETSNFPSPMFNVINGGLHADSGMSFQEFMLLPKAETFPEQVRIGAEVFHALGSELKTKGLSTMVGDEGGYAPKLHSNEEPMQLLQEAIEKAGYNLGNEIELGLDAASTVFQKENGYELTLEHKTFSADELTKQYLQWHPRYHLASVEDGLGEDDWKNWPAHTAALLQAGMLVVGDDLFVTNVERLQRGIDEKVANAILIKVNQIGTLSETIDAIRLAQSVGYKVIISHRSGETTDTTIADLAVAVGADYIKAGSLSRGERLAKYNRLLTIWNNLHE